MAGFARAHAAVAGRRDAAARQGARAQVRGTAHGRPRDRRSPRPDGRHHRPGRGARSARHRIRRADLLFNASHTHCGPVVDEQLSVAYDLSPEQWAAIRAYTTQLEDKLAAVIGSAVSRLRPARLGVRARRSRLCGEPAREVHAAGARRSLRARAPRRRSRRRAACHRLRVRVPQHDAAGPVRAVSRRLRGRRPGRVGTAAPGRDRALRRGLRRRREPDAARDAGTGGGPRRGSRGRGRPRAEGGGSDRSVVAHGLRHRRSAVRAARRRASGGEASSTSRRSTCSATPR